ncbi:MAG: uridine phosphorylase [Bacillaceae bacterium]|nr:uridine phosphorylase [Bacillaceae bacterium]
MVYSEFTKNEWLDALGMRENQIPESFIVHGEWSPDENLKWWQAKLQDPVLPKWNTVVGRYQGKQIGFANVYGSPMATNIIHPFASAGTETFIQTGYFGGLTNRVNYGDILIVTEAEMKDGVSHYYLHGNNRVHSDEQLIEKAVHYCEKNGYSYVLGSVVSISSFHVETTEMIRNWAAENFIGVDMETACTLAVSKKFNRKGISLLNLTDHLIQGDHLYDGTEERERLEAETDDKIRDLALYLTCSK